MAIKVLVVDDSSFFRRRVSEILEKDRGLEVVGSANNGKEAVAQVKKLKPDVITMDIEMPVMDGISAVKVIMAENPTPILMFSSLTQEGAKATLDALDAGAMDFLPKKFEDIAKDRDEAASLLQSRVTALGRRRAMPARRAAPAPTPSAGGRTPVTPRPLAGRTPSVTASTASSDARRSLPAKRSGKRYKLVAIGTSTGGPVALQTILTKIPANFPQPIILIQHMPASFTGAFAQRLNSICKLKVSEAKDGDVLRPGHAYLAPGGKQMLVEGRDSNARLRIIDGGDKVNYKPCVDVTFAACAKVFGGDVLAVVLTGMGADGRDGARLLKQKGAKIWAQDEKSCVVYGMPQAVAAAGLSEASIPLDQCAERIIVEAGNG
ncbi:MULTISPECIES: protein-glutamate methylesterase/protein-glutamine glutaminase [Corallincola]|uniref:Protein-glutamate methylesterase/protein-glutamine glutaminase n=3 Tax=Corallincola TaxID=1775176 RepID=A0A368N4S1_9GAMM|nr:MULTISPECIES: chemotaxis response regulator protein-glutamate methylesterase [Corallincola]RCU44551.1 chemotaxis response regulator protein-glutamate methylesterase [Corallincola holothuriorum]TAA40296.1 chemotaxis response regulator protein-glutamate methylesterase [Corallincola spongiicola]TCI05397.1 chemotaxis response regulator protein-glutamate methylesterase [Corallincola luteus]